MALQHQCCGASIDSNHEPYCPMIADIDARFKRDFSGETFRDSYINHSASAIRKRVLAAGNGQSNPGHTFIEPRWL